MSRREQLAYMIGLMSYGGNSGLEAAYEFGKQNGVSTHLHEGKEQEFFEEQDHTAEWLMGQVMVLHEYRKSDDYDRVAYLMTFHSISNRATNLLSEDTQNSTK
ncbi:hypothetical protein BCJMU51_p2071 (plasmid) [Bacillus cereus]|uniref:hypothetical protein n=1 Tax=Bacillus cereus TaxID=1396 RepID=UPI001925CD7E|nr:hypothetical protein [Bacillus cereus]HDR7526725.1 hypothetical protein [Bacillus paranthracis]MBL3785623.1 hypothetical protein [Bacillus cereus]MBL3802436.1 hypothetical protein [Bacillus cereus]MBL3817420.1 hypothetical protein [Bacillus cereus]BCC74216.1 hypothetical protein BCJMU51_p2071 [Bacillus cereus]